MSEPLSFFIPGQPKGQPRVRAFVRGHRAGVFDPGTADDWKACVMIAARKVLASMSPQRPVLTGPIKADLAYVFPRPKAHFNSKGNALKPGAPVHHTAKPDRDNLDKAVLDTLTLVELWKDDAQVCAGTTVKRFAALGEASGCHVTLSSLS